MLLAGTLLAFSVAAFVEPVSLAGERVVRNYGEGWNATNAQRLAAGMDLYPGREELFGSNYPPLYHEALSVAAVAGLDVIEVGRWASLAAMVAAAVMAGSAVLTWTRSGSAAMVTVALVVLLPAGHAPGYIGTTDPTWMAHALMLAGLLLLQRSPTQRSFIVASALAIVAGGFIKHSLVALPASLAVWLVLSDGKVAKRWIATAVTAVVGGFAACTWIYGYEFLHAIFHTARTYSPGWAFWSAWSVKWSLAAAAFLIFDLAHSKSFGPARLVTIYLLSAGLLASILAGGGGVADNIWFDLHLAVALGLGLSLGMRLRCYDERKLAFWSPVVVSATLAVVVLPVLVARAAGVSPGAIEVRRQRLQQDIAYLQSIPGSVACTDLALCYWAGKVSTIDFYGLQQRLETHRIEPRQVAAFLSRNDVEVVQVYGAGMPGWPMLPGPAISSIANDYLVARRSGENVFYRRRSE